MKSACGRRRSDFALRSRGLGAVCLAVLVLVSAGVAAAAGQPIWSAQVLAAPVQAESAEELRYSILLAYLAEMRRFMAAKGTPLPDPAQAAAFWGPFRADAVHEVYPAGIEAEAHAFDVSGAPASPAAKEPPGLRPFDKTLTLQGIRFRVVSANQGSINRVTISPSGLGLAPGADQRRPLSA